MNEVEKKHCYREFDEKLIADIWRSISPGHILVFIPLPDNVRNSLRDFAIPITSKPDTIFFKKKTILFL